MKTDFIQLETISSTNTWAKEHRSQFHPAHLTCITADEQTAGKGRQQKKWISPKGSNLYVTLYFTIPQYASYISNLGQIMALSCAELLHTMHVNAQIKWPNDILVDNKKIGGVLTETTPQNHSTGIILGLGLNINMPETILESIDQPATSLHLILNKQVKPSSLLEPLLEQFTSHLEQLKIRGFAFFRHRFFEFLAYKGKLITLHLPEKNIQGICDSITPEGCLKLRLPSGDYRIFSAGEVS
jgi:BirA family biotin operon repressor/biotin-[acetyl-CoA-carboxylase] ligase